MSGIGLFALIGPAAGAQDASDVGGWFGMMLTPYGALPPVVTPAMSGVGPTTGRVPLSFDFRYGHWDFGGGEEPINSFGLAGRARNVGITLGYGRCDDCDDGTLMAGIEFESVLARMPVGATSSSSLIVGLRPAIGYATATGDAEGNAFSATVDLPLSLPFAVGSGLRLVPFVVPGVGFGRFEDTEPAFEDGESGVRPSVGAGVALLMNAGVGIHFGWRQVILEDAPSMLGVGISVQR